MSRYYKAKDVEIALVFSGLCDGKTCKEVRKVLNSIPTIDRPQGEWIMHIDDLFPCESTQECSVCHAEQLINGNDDNYCPNCGAHMKGADDE